MKRKLKIKQLEVKSFIANSNLIGGGIWPGTREHCPGQKDKN